MRPGLLRTVVVVQLLQGVALVGIAVFLAVRSTGNDVDDRTGAVFGALVALVGGACFAGLGLALRPPARRFAVTPSMVLQFLCLPVAYGLFQAHKDGYGAPLLISGLVGLACLIAGGGLGEPRT